MLRIVCDDALVRRGLGLLGVAALLLSAGSACGSTRIEPISATVCGVPIGRAEYSPGGGPVYLDLVRGTPTTAITAAAQSAPMSIRVSGNCAHGARYDVSDTAVIGVSPEVRAKDGGAVVLSVSPYRPGSSVIQFGPPAGASVSVTVEVRPPIIPSTLASRP